MTDNESRFLGEIVSRIPVEQILEVRLFAPMRQGGTESCVAVVASEETPLAASGESPAADSEETFTADSEETPAADSERCAIHTASYRHTYKGPERGKWEFDLAAEADAPLLTVDSVVSGVLQRSGEQSEPVRLSADDLRAAIGETNWTATKP